MKKVWIASILATLMLTVLLTSVVSANEVEDCNCKPTISDLQVVRIERLLNKVKIYTNFISLLSKNNPEIKEKCEELSNMIITLKEINKETLTPPQIICSALIFLFLTTYITSIYVYTVGMQFEEFNLNKIANMIYQISEKLLKIAHEISDIISELDCL